MTDPTHMLFSGHWEEIVFFAGMFVFMFALCLPHYITEKDKEKKKDTLVQWAELDGLFAVGVAIAVFFG